MRCSAMRLPMEMGWDGIVWWGHRRSRCDVELRRKGQKIGFGRVEGACARAFPLRCVSGSPPPSRFFPDSVSQQIDGQGRLRGRYSLPPTAGNRFRQCKNRRRSVVKRVAMNARAQRGLERLRAPVFAGRYGCACGLRRNGVARMRNSWVPTLAGLGWAAARGAPGSSAARGESGGPT